MKEPQRRVGGVVEAFVSAVGEEIGDESVADIMSEGAKDVTGLVVPAGGQGQALQRDHRVAAPVREPVVAGDNSADFVAAGPGPGGVLVATRRRDDELVRR